MSDDARTVAFNDAAPDGEKFDAGAELAKSHRTLASSLIPASDMKEVIAFIEDGLAQGAMMKATGNIIEFPGGRPHPPPARGMLSVYLDDLQIFMHGTYFEKPAPLGFEALRLMVDKTPPLSAVLMTRIRQISRFCQVSEDGGPGFEIRHTDRKHKLSPEEQDAAQLLARFFQNCGWEFNPRARKRLRRDNLRQFMAKSVRDTLTMDAAPIETELKRNRALGLDGFYAVDGAIVRLCTEEGYDGDDEIFALQVVQGRICTAYNYDQLIYEVRNPRTDVRLAGYGLGETELLIRVVTGFLNAMSYNIAGFDQNAIPKGILNLFGDYGQEDVIAFKRYWNQMVKGINNAWALPVMVSKDKESGATFQNLGVEFDEMMFSKWMTFLTSIICAVYGMSPDEINFESFAASKSSLSGSDTEEKLANSKDIGLLPVMAFYEATFSDFIVPEFNDKFCFRWVGLQDEDEQWAQDSKKLILKVDELRAEQGYEPWGGLLGEAPVNPALLGAWQAQQQALQPQQPEQDFGNAPPEGQGGDDQSGAPQDASGDQPPGGASGAQPDAGNPPGNDFGGQQQQGEFGKAFVPTIYSIGD